MILDRILTSKRAEIVAALKESPHGPPRTLPRIDVCARLERGPAASRAPLRILAEIKRKSPSAGALSTTLSITERARIYAKSGAALISILCDGPFFGGSYEDLTAVRAALDEAQLSTPLLAKEFILDEVQLRKASAMGADAALLIVRILPPERLGALVKAARAYGLEPLVEVASGAELAIALQTDARVIGVNARDLDTLRIDPVHAASLVAAVPEGRVALHLSGVKTDDDVRTIAAGRADGALVGEILMRQHGADDVQKLLSGFVAAAG